VLFCDAPEQLTQGFTDSYQELVSDLGIAKLDDIRRRCADIKDILPRICDVAESIIAANDEIEDD
jgi:hypothetical protein